MSRPPTDQFDRSAALSPAPVLPTGTVTFLFTDIEGSTRLLRRLGDRYAGLLEEHNRVVTDAVEEHGGVRVGTDGDAVFAVFSRASEAVTAAVGVQKELTARTWPGGVSVRVRMGIHSGEGVLGGENYVGLDVNRAARVAAAGHGGQVLVTDATRALAERDLPHGVTLRDLGEHELKDLEHPERLFQLVIEGLPSDFPPPRSLSSGPNNLPRLLTSFVGREREVVDVLRLLAGNRLITLTGPGGTGKTRLALQVAGLSLGDFPDGVYLVALASITDPALVASTVARALDVPEDPSRSVEDTLAGHLVPRQMLLVLDNFEQVIPAATLVADLLAAAPRLQILVTSREVLHLSGEQEYPVPPLALPDVKRLPPLDALSQYDAVALFIQRARAADPSFAVTNDNAPAVAEICIRLDGLPLAIELAAARVRIFPPEALLARLEHRLELRGGPRDLPARQRTLRDAIAWSYDLLDETERRLFRRLGIFVGGWSVTAAHDVAAPDAENALEVGERLGLLVDKSLVRPGRAFGQEPWFWMLETIREYARERLEASGEAPEAGRRHAAHFLALAERAEPGITSDPIWLERLGREHDNLRAVLAWAIDSGEPETGLRIGAAVWRFWHLHGHLHEGRSWLERLLAMPGASGRTRVRARGLAAAASLAYWQGDYEPARAWYEESLEVAGEIGDDASVADALLSLAFMAGIAERYDAAMQLYDESREMFRRIGNAKQEAWATLGRGLIAQLVGDLEAARPILVEGRRLFEAIGDRFGLSQTLIVHARVEQQGGDIDAARRMLLDVLDLYREIADVTGRAGWLDDVAVIMLKQGDAPLAVRLLAAAAAAKERIGGGAPPPLVRLPDVLEQARALIADDVIAAELERGRALTLEEAVEQGHDALRRPSPAPTEPDARSVT